MVEAKGEVSLYVYVELNSQLTQTIYRYLRHGTQTLKYSLKTFHSFRSSFLNSIWCVVQREESSNQVVSIKVEFGCLARAFPEMRIGKTEEKQKSNDRQLHRLHASTEKLRLDQRTPGD